MSFLTDLFKEIPLSAVLKEKLEAFEEENASLKQDNASLKDDLRQAKAEIAKLKEEIERLTHKPDVQDEEMKVLWWLAQGVESKTSSELARTIQMLSQRVEYNLQELMSKGLVYHVHDHLGWDKYNLTQAGRKLLIDKGLL